VNIRETIILSVDIREIGFEDIAKGWVYQRAFVKAVLILQLKKNGEFFIS
jgi:hypothetical protein